MIGSGIVMRKYLLQLITKEYQISDSQFDKDFKKARNEIQKLNKPKIQKQIANAILRLQILYNKNFKMQDYRECRNVQAELNKLLGLYQPDKIKLTTEFTAPSVIVDNEETANEINKIRDDQ